MVDDDLVDPALRERDRMSDVAQKLTRRIVDPVDREIADGAEQPEADEQRVDAGEPRGEEIARGCRVRLVAEQ